ncbi:2955_t:CDS:2 [Acaulospora morrowiae]|uniref:2955_t:CDS:1 n=1 Tax=Acaulospora morrowiae TaxID=94023 RepID=A0A9N8ZGS6_9GLOM|nr:2955_t:CDS:2 [Acaulospora morrowiae]
MGDIPFACPSSYTYPSEAVEDACKIRKGNLICMWIYYVILVIMTMTGFPRIFYNVDDDYNEDLREGGIIDLSGNEEKSSENASLYFFGFIICPMYFIKKNNFR